MDDERTFPTMIIPNGTEIAVNEHGQLSIRTPGNLVIQNSGRYSIIESTSGSIRIDPEVKVEAVSLQAADSCFVAGTLTAWRVRARKIILEKGAQAYIMLQESETLELDRSARLVGNFASEKELYLMLGRFSRELRRLPQLVQPGEPAPPLEGGEGEGEEPFVAPDGEDEPPAVTRQRREEVLALVRVVVERELGRDDLEEPARAALRELLDLVREGDLERLREASAYLMSQVPDPSEELGNAAAVLEQLPAEAT